MADTLQLSSAQAVVPSIGVTPAFVREIPSNSRDEEHSVERFIFWAPERLGDDATDYATGQRHFRTALSFAHANRSTNLLASIVGGMCGGGCGPMELGFIELLSRKAVYGSLPAPFTETMARHIVCLTGQSIEEIRFDEEKAGRCLTFARLHRSPEIVQSLLIQVINRTMGRGDAERRTLEPRSNAQH